MELERKHIEAIKYRLDKLGVKATNGDIRVAALNFDILDLDAIADRTIHDVQFKSSQLAVKEPLSDITKSSLVKLEAAQMGIEVSDSELLQIIDSSDRQISDTAQFLIDVRELLREFLYQRNQNLAAQNQSLIGSVTEVINEANQEKARIIAETNQQLMSVVNQCKEANNDYKSPYTGRVQSMRETLFSKYQNQSL